MKKLKQIFYIFLIGNLLLTGSLNLKLNAAAWASSGNNLYFSDAGGRVGIGTNNPFDPLHIKNVPTNTGISDEGKMLVGNTSGSWWFYGGRDAGNGVGYNNLATNGYLSNGWFRRDTSKETWILSTYNTNGPANGQNGYFKIFYSQPQSNASAITNLKTLFYVEPSGKVYVRELLVSNTWSDYVFDKNYKLMSLSDVEKFIKENGHLPEIPSAKEVESKGLAVGEMQQKQMAKIEELTLYAIEQEKKINELEARLARLERLVEKK